jgi:hypothetical protein
MIIAVVQIPMPRRPREAAVAAQTKSAPTYRGAVTKGLPQRRCRLAVGSTIGPPTRLQRLGTHPSGAPRQKRHSARNTFPDPDVYVFMYASPFSGGMSGNPLQ